MYRYGTTEEGTTASKFTEYPSQDGALFVWGANPGNPVIRYAWDMITSSIPPNWENVGNATVWSDIGADNETCPEGYRRPNDGPTNTAGVISEAVDLEFSEVRVSLFDQFNDGTGNMNATNFSSGYYADGFFDRRSSPGDFNVATNTNDIASSGIIYYNPANYASIFFPTGLSRNGDGTAANGTSYQTTASDSSGQCRSFASTWIYYGGKYYAHPVRCVKDLKQIP